MAYTDNYRVIDEPYDNTEDLRPFYDALRERIAAAGEASRTAGPPLASPNATFGSQWREEDEIPTKIALANRWNGGAVDPMSNVPQFAEAAPPLGTRILPFVIGGADPLPLIGLERTLGVGLPTDYDYQALHNLMRAQYTQPPQEPEPSWWSATPENANQLPMGLSTSLYNIRRNLAEFAKPFYGGVTPKPQRTWSSEKPTQGPSPQAAAMPTAPSLWNNYAKNFREAMHSGDPNAIQQYIDSVNVW